MAPRKLTQIERWIGTEAERLALDASGFSPGSTFFERDTGSMHKWDGTSWGKEIITVADIADIKTAIESLDNKELATELTLAQILTILGGTAADIGTLKLENGQIKGYDGTDWQPVRVNEAGELILASEVTVNAEGLSVDLGKLVLQAKNPSGVPVDMKSDTEGNLKVSLSGTMVEEVLVNAASVPAGGDNVVTIDTDGCSLLIVSVNTTQPHEVRTLVGSSGTPTSDPIYNKTYPLGQWDDVVYPHILRPKIFVWVGLNMGSDLWVMDSYFKALEYALPPPRHIRWRVINRGDDNMTLTVKVQKIWRG